MDGQDGQDFFLLSCSFLFILSIHVKKLLREETLKERGIDREFYDES